MLLVAGIGAFRRIPDEKVSAAFHTGLPLNDWPHDLFSDPGIYSGLQNHDGAFL